MKKILIAVGALGVMSFTSNQLMNTFLLAEAVINIQDLQEWIEQDIYNNRIDQSVAIDYIDTLNETEDLLIEFYNANYRLNTNK
tara:strand:- start:140 stop:391 length:252 start_codon:yes stop_codon:yes gene_type:complete